MTKSIKDLRSCSACGVEINRVLSTTALSADRSANERCIQIAERRLCAPMTRLFDL
jgi:hypothetical protein